MLLVRVCMFVKSIMNKECINYLDDVYDDDGDDDDNVMKIHIIKINK
jgi:hypothetical protein